MMAVLVFIICDPSTACQYHIAKAVLVALAALGLCPSLLGSGLLGRPQP